MRAVYQASGASHRRTRSAVRLRFISLALAAVLLSSCASTLHTPVEAHVDVATIKGHTLRANLGRTDVRRVLPAGRAIGWTLFVTGLAIAVLGMIGAASAPGGSPDGETATGLAELGVGVLTLGGALFLSNLNDDVTVRDRSGVPRP